MSARPYAGSVDQAALNDLVRQFGDLLADAVEVGVILTYHAVNEEGGSGSMMLAGTGISQAQLCQIMADALDHNESEGDTL